VNYSVTYTFKKDFDFIAGFR